MHVVKILSDNTVANLRPKGLLAEWGFSALIDDVLFDTGQKVVLENMRLLGVEDFSCIVLSHGHYDHTGSLLPVLEVYGKKKVFAHPDSWLTRVYKDTPIGIPWSREVIEEVGEVIEHKDPVKVSKDIIALGEIPRKEKDMRIGKILKNGVWQEDAILDDQSLAVKTKNGILLVLGCCHSGLRNTVSYAEEVCSDEVKYIVGGTHLVSANSRELLEIAEWLKEKVELIAPCHCTGFKAQAVLSEKLKDKFVFTGVGSILSFD